MKGVSKSSRRLIDKITTKRKRTTRRNTRNRNRQHHAERVQVLPEVHIPDQEPEQMEIHLPRGGRQ